MAKSRNNVVTHGLSGKIGNMLVFRQRNGKTVVSNTPRISSKQKSDRQLLQRQKFLQAVSYAKAVVADDETKLTYQSVAKNGLTAYNMAVADMLNAPEIQDVNISGYTGKPADVIQVKATDDFKVAQVTVEILKADGSVVEKGNAVSNDAGFEWLYGATVNVDSVNGCKVIVKAMDLPGNVTALEKMIA